MHYRIQLSNLFIHIEINWQYKGCYMVTKDWNGIDESDRPSQIEVIEEYARGKGITRSHKEYNILASKIGDLPALLMLTKKKDRNVSKSGFYNAIEVITGIADKKPINASIAVSGKDSKLLGGCLSVGGGFLQDDFDNMKGLSVGHFSFELEKPVPRNLMIDGARGKIVIDLAVTLEAWITKPDGKRACIELARVAVEFDGPIHVNDENVRKDKLRDSGLHSLGYKVFRVQTPYKLKGHGSTRLNRENSEAELKKHINNIKESLRKSLYEFENYYHFRYKLCQSTSFQG